MATTAESLIGPELTFERVAGGVLPKVLNSFDMVAIFVAIVLFISNVPGFFGNGPVSITLAARGLSHFLDPRRNRHRPARLPVPRGGLDLPLDAQGVRSLRQLLRGLRGPVAGRAGHPVDGYRSQPAGPVPGRLDLRSLAPGNRDPGCDRTRGVGVRAPLPADSERGQPGLRPLRPGHPVGGPGRHPVAGDRPQVLHRLLALRRKPGWLVPGA